LSKGDDQLRPDLAREEVRGVFVIGILAILFSLRLDSRFALYPLKMLDVLVLYWGLYVGLASLGVSSDLLGERVARSFYRVARASFKWGILLTGVACLDTLVLSAVSGNLMIPSVRDVSILIVSLLSFFTLLELLDFLCWKKYATKPRAETVIALWLMACPLFLLALAVQS
jgi:hypothetical protein